MAAEPKPDALERFRKVFKDFSSVSVDAGRITEADTRANILDRLIHEVLEWPRGSVSREKHGKVVYLDYELSRGIPLLVIEAKASGETFQIPYRKTAGIQRLKLNGSLQLIRMSEQQLNRSSPTATKRAYGSP